MNKYWQKQQQPKENQHQEPLPKAPAPKLLLTVSEAAESLGLGQTMVYQLLQRKELASVKIGRARRIRVRDLEEYVAQLETNSSLG
jgi:excisionase family DNA binding protein